MTAYYNEIDPYAAAWLRNLIAAGHIAPGDVDERSITEVQADDLTGYTQCHFFAGIGGWSYALRLAGWADDRPVWTGSCPCQPLSSAGQRKGHADERHLWPAFHGLITQCAPAVVFGEQVAGSDGREWMSAVRADLEGSGYAVGAADLCAAGVGAPHIRQRLYWVAVAPSPGLQGCGSARAARPRGQGGAVKRNGATGGLADAASFGRIGRWPSEASDKPGAVKRPERLCDADRPSPLLGFWGNADWLFCRDERWWPAEPGTFPLAHGVSGRVGRLRAYGNAIVPQVAAAFISAFEEVTLQ